MGTNRDSESNEEGNENVSRSAAEWYEALCNYDEQAPYDDDKIQFWREFLTKAGAGMDSFEVRDEGEEEEAMCVQLRGALRGVPVKINIDWEGMDAHWVFVQANMDARAWFTFDPKKIPKKKKKGDPWSGKDTGRVFTARGIFLEDENEKAIAAGVSVWKVLSADVRKRIEETMRIHHADSLVFEGNEIQMSVLNEELEKSEDPVAVFADFSNLLADIAGEMEGTEILVKGGVEYQFRLKRCSYCGSKNALGEEGHCVNCGAPYE